MVDVMDLYGIPMDMVAMNSLLSASFRKFDGT